MSRIIEMVRTTLSKECQKIYVMAIRLEIHHTILFSVITIREKSSVLIMYLLT